MGEIVSNGSVEILATGTPVGKGQKTMAASLPVALASDQSVINTKQGAPTINVGDSQNGSTAATGVAVTFTAGANGGQVQVAVTVGLNAAVQVSLRRAGATGIRLQQPAAGTNLSNLAASVQVAGAATVVIQIDAAVLASSADFELSGVSY